MRPATSVHITRIERGDLLNIAVTDSRALDDWEGPAQFAVTVARTIRSARHGWMIQTQEDIGPEKEDTFYLADDWEIKTPEGLWVVE